MNHQLKKFIAISGIIVTLTGCAEGMTNGSGGLRKSAIGGGVGAVSGALIGSTLGKGNGRLFAVAAGTALGALAGSSIGASMDKNDIAYHNRTTMNALEFNKSGVQSTWNNPDSGARGTIVPSQAYQASNGEYCREYTQTVYVGGKQQQAHGQACRMPDGTWKIKS